MGICDQQSFVLHASIFGLHASFCECLEPYVSPSGAFGALHGPIFSHNSSFFLILMQIRIRTQLFTLMRIRIRLFKMMWTRICKPIVVKFDRNFQCLYSKLPVPYLTIPLLGKPFCLHPYGFFDILNLLRRIRICMHSLAQTTNECTTVYTKR
jgi:hypothetical protein